MYFGLYLLFLLLRKPCRVRSSSATWRETSITDRFAFWFVNFTFSCCLYHVLFLPSFFSFALFFCILLLFLLALAQQHKRSKTTTVRQQQQQPCYNTKNTTNSARRDKDQLKHHMNSNPIRLYHRLLTQLIHSFIQSTWNKKCIKMPSKSIITLKYTIYNKIRREDKLGTTEENAKYKSPKRFSDNSSMIIFPMIFSVDSWVSRNVSSFCWTQLKLNVVVVNSGVYDSSLSFLISSNFFQALCVLYFLLFCD